jgi:hypothetical protein
VGTSPPRSLVGARGPFYESLLFKGAVVLLLKLAVLPLAARGIKVCDTCVHFIACW